MKTILSAIAIGGMLFSGMAVAQTVSEADQQFMQKAAQSNIAEVATGKLAQSKSPTTDIKKFGQDMEKDHGKTHKELQALAKAKGVSLPDSPDEPHQALAKQLSAASGKEFDRIYIKNAGVADHKAAKELFETGAKSKDAEISAFAKKVLPHIEHHLAMAQKISESM